MSKFRVSPRLARTIASVAGELRAELRQGGVKLDRDALIAAVTSAITQAATGKRSRELTAASAPATYTRAGDILGLAHQTFLAKDYKSSFELVTLAFQDPSSMDLIGAIIANNDEAKQDDPEHAGAFDNKLDDPDSDDDDSSSTTAADHDVDVDDDDDTENADDDDDDDDYTSDLNDAVDNVTAGLVTADADDDDDGENADDDDDAALSDDDDDDDDATMSDDDDDDTTLSGDDDDDDDDDVTEAALTGDNMPGIMAKLVRRINDPSIIAAANKVSVSGSTQDRKKALGFLASAANISNKKPRQPNRLKPRRK